MVDDVSNPLGPGALGSVRGAAFLLSTQEWYAIQRYVAGALALPDTEQKMRFRLAKEQNGQKIAFIGPIDEFKNLIAGYQSIIPHVQKWKDKVFPETVVLAQNISEYALKAESYYGRLRSPIEALLSDPDDKAAKALLVGICKNLSKDAAEYEKRAVAVYKEIREFAANTKKDEQLLKTLAVEYDGKFGKHSAAMKDWNGEVVILGKQIEDLNKDYEHACLVAKTTPTYAWILLWVAVIVAGVYGDRAVKLQRDMNVKRDRIKTLGEETARALVLTSTLAVAIKGLGDIQEKIAQALPAIQKIQGAWNALGAFLAKVEKAIQGDIVNEENILKEVGVDWAISLWLECKKKSDAYQVNAFVTVADNQKAA